MRSFTTAIVLLSILSEFASAHPSFISPRAEPKPVKIPIEELFEGSTIEKSGKGDGTIYSFTMPKSDTKKPASGGSDSESDLIAGSKIGNPCANDPCCTLLGNGESFEQVPRWEMKDWSQHLGLSRAISQPLCPPGSVTDSTAVSYTYSINVQLGPDLKFGPAILDKFGIRVGFAWTWGETKTVGYTAVCSDGNNFPCLAYFTPRLGKINGIGWMETIGADKKTVCSKTEKSYMEINVPIVKSDLCRTQGPLQNPCGPEGKPFLRLFRDSVLLLLILFILFALGTNNMF
ncbi:hypothetical protein PTTW11_03086 [Pyrenophora teres f. teres]|uniref:Uncharacterized protein n=1 Tax=Pyrenophora teres f. teres TaxID=97479 RepID=A0A6S6VWM0_9PLEO|nr:hypothetical protein PTTW11_03086 [Pyrenophora teres f. teres]